VGGALSTDLTAFYNRPANDTSTVAGAVEYYNRPDPALQGNRQQRRALAAQKRRKKK
jgi:hypothetical protein